jgi:hypothetical protein
MPKIATFVKGVIRRAKKMKGQIYLGLGITAFSFALYCLIQQPTEYVLWIVLSAFALGWLIAAYLYADKKDRQERALRMVESVQEDIARTESNRLLSQILEELKKPNQSKDTPRND